MDWTTENLSLSIRQITFLVVTFWSLYLEPVIIYELSRRRKYIGVFSISVRRLSSSTSRILYREVRETVLCGKQP